MALNKIKGSVFESSDNFSVASIDAIPAIKKADREGIIIIGGSRGGTFKYSPALSQDNHNNVTIFSASATYEVADLGCWIRIMSTSQGSLAWAGADDTAVANLLEAYGVDGLQVRITEAGLGGLFQFNSLLVANHDGVNNFNGWIRVTDLNFFGHINMQGNRVTNTGAALASTDTPNLTQVLDLVAQGNFVGITPLYSPLVTGDGVTIAFPSEANGTVDPLLMTPQVFEVIVDGLALMPDLEGIPGDYSVDTGTGNIIFAVAPANGAEVNIKWFAPILLSDVENLNITATGSGLTKTMQNWVGLEAGDIEILAEGALTPVNLKTRFNRIPTYFSTLSDMLTNYNRMSVGSFAVLKGMIAAGDGGFGTYFIRTKADADANGIFYGTGTSNILIPDAGAGWVAEFQTGNEFALVMVETVLTAGQQLVSYSDSVLNMVFFLSGENVDRGRLVKDQDFTVNVDNKSITLVESYPAGTIVLGQLPTVKEVGGLGSIVTKNFGSASDQIQDNAANRAEFAVLVQQNLNAVVDPVLTDDINAGYSKLSPWFNTVTKEAFRCYDNAAGAAVWEKTTLTVDELGSAAFVDVDPTIATVTGTTHIMTASDPDLTRLTNVGVITLTLPAATTEDIGVGKTRFYELAGDGSVNVIAEDGTVNIESEGGLVDIKTKYRTISIMVVAAQTFKILGAEAP